MTPEELGNEKAFPLISPDGTGVNQGMTLREYFAAKAMQGLMTKDYVKLHIDIAGGGESGYTNIPMIADMSVQIADALLAELAKTY
jgi:hypothetical protein